VDRVDRSAVIPSANFTVTNRTPFEPNLQITWRYETELGARGQRGMHDRGDKSNRRAKPKRGPLYSGGLGWDVVILLILGSSLALASVVWFLVGLLLNAQQPAPTRLDLHEKIEPPSFKYEAAPQSYLSAIGERHRAMIYL
jgi:hypothetical protein